MKKLLLCLAFLVCALPVSAQTTVILVRHAERADGGGNDPTLTDVGRKRAARLAEFLAHSNVSVVYSTPLARAKETAAPVVAALKAQLLETQATAQYAQNTAERIRKNNVGQTVLVVGHSNTTPALVKALTGVDVPAIAEDDYSNLYVITIAADGKTSLIRAKYF